MKKKLIFASILCLALSESVMAQDKLYSDEFPLGDVTRIRLFL